ncbi:aldehyde dehydrogenase family protein [Saccharopolyspora erythraea]|uniref:aldehyde dehydrogenase family protein n=1 Tax=Saccharopolyspora erythraea TaxID=1836 RepID=UPI002012ACBE|nr:aldehyde dehydrogenase family protein [Saccharopolyspora erythraea]
MTELLPSPARPAEVSALIGADRLAGQGWIDDVDPSRGAVVARLARCGAAEVATAVATARETFRRQWRRRPASERGSLLRAVADRIRAEAEDLAVQESTETGKPLRQGRADVAAAARYFEFYGSVVEALHGEIVPQVGDNQVFVHREPHGVTGHIVPWNYPLQITARSAAASLAAGNCCVIKPAEEASLGAVRLAEIALEAGVPAGCFNVVTGLGEEAGAALAAAPVDHLAFTGSVEVGRLVAAAAGRNLVPTTMELGGKSPNIVFDDADLELALPTIVNSIVQNGGQTCSAGSRLLVHRDVHRRVVDGIAERFRALRLGPALEDPDLGPLISAAQRERVAGLVGDGAGDGRLVTGGRAAEGPGLDDGYFFEPTLVDDVAPDSLLAREEIFGPVLAVTPFDDLDEAVRIANGTDFGLVAAVWTRNVGRAHWISRELDAGQVFVNTYGAGGGVELPFGGVKNSGFGREKGFEGLLAYTRTKTVAVRSVADDDIG